VPSTEVMHKWKALMTISEEWLAGFFDGEGCINITVAGKHRRCILRLYIVNTDMDVLSRIQSEYGGFLSERVHPNHPNWKPCGTLTWTNQQARELLERIGKHIILKRRQLDLALEFLSLRGSPDRFEVASVAGVPSRNRKFVRRISADMLVKESGLKEKMHDLNRKGRSVH